VTGSHSLFPTALVLGGDGSVSSKAKCAVKNILVPVDFSDVTDRVVSAAEKLAFAFNAKVWLMHCIYEYPALAAMGEVPVLMPTAQNKLPQEYAVEYRQLDQLTSALRGRGINTEMLFVCGSPTEEIVSAAEAHDIDLIVLGSHGHGPVYGLLVGTVTEGVMRLTPRQILIVPSEARRDKRAVTSSPYEKPTVTPH